MCLRNYNIRICDTPILHRCLFSLTGFSFEIKWLMVVKGLFTSRQMMWNCLKRWFRKLSSYFVSSNCLMVDTLNVQGWRVVNESGLVAVLHPWDSGLDSSPAYDPALGVPERTPPPLTHIDCRRTGQAYFPLVRWVLEYNILKGNTRGLSTF